MSGTLTQIRALVGLRWRMVRSRRVRLGLALLTGGVVVLFGLAVVAGRLLPTQREFNAAILTPTAFVVFAVLAVIGPLAAGGGNELFPASEMAIYPVRPSTVFVTAVLMTPLNIAWIAQTTTLLSLTAYVAGSWPRVPAAVAITAVYVAAATTAGQALAWWLVTARRTTRGRYGVWALAGLAVAAVALALHVGLTSVLDRAPTRPVVLAMFDGANGRYRPWAWALVVLALIAVAGVAAGIKAVAFAGRHPSAAHPPGEAERVRRRSSRRSAAAHLHAIDRAGVWRAPALRRGVLVMALLPASAAAAARVHWSGLAITSGLVAVGAALLFGVNAFCLDGGGALWLGSLPLAPRDHIRAKARVLTEICLIACALTLLGGASRSKGPLTLTDVTTLVATVAACTGSVVAASLRLSVRRPHRAQMSGPRDTPVPPGSMAVYSARLAASTTLVALVVVAGGQSELWWAPLALASCITVISMLSVRRTVREFETPLVRTTVLTTVANG